ncbi:hypothetical protein BGP77_12180 [Saccharospirillum sp. MSK14-1]|uniref:outer membrane beta-barrel protein n=1 Tax=Saccharospirillum sp. MSK14-1 TaxID=1897632 RepID=UPI000D38551C|nr:outer membrane beta-barrel protein [Saccharospirillum sp. MSK14-1]PTY38461.1 hypothetical protein BGP77_12180 [Saccharospirillum sp. MSK14-1]
MKRLLLALPLGLISSTFTVSAQAEGAYLSASVEAIEFASDSVSLLFDSAAPVVSVGAGWRYTPYFGWESKVGIGLSEYAESDSFAGYNHDFTLNLSGYFSTMLVGIWPLMEGLDLYAKGGITHLSYAINQSYENDAGNDNNSRHTTGFSLTPTVRFGIAYRLLTDWSLGVESTYLGRIETDWIGEGFDSGPGSFADESGDFYGVTATLSRHF